MAVYYKPQSPIQSGEDFIYPITTADQVKVDKDTRLNAVGVYLKNIDNSTDTTVYGNNATTLGGVAAEDYALKTDTAPDSSKLGGKAPEYYIQPRNLLDNSDFRNPVNQRGATTAENSFIVDRWYTFNDNQGGGAALTSSGITLSGNGYLQQRFSKGILQMDKPYTFAVYYSDSTVDVGTNGVIIFGDGDFDLVNNVYANGKTISHVALYEGSYTADTLPPYVPKGYAAELAECDLYYRPLGDNVMSVIGMTSSDGGVVLLKSIRPMREGGVPTVINNGTLYARVNGTDYTTTTVRINKSDKSGVEIFVNAAGAPSKQTAMIHGSALFALSRDL